MFFCLLLDHCDSYGLRVFTGKLTDVLADLDLTGLACLMAHTVFTCTVVHVTEWRTSIRTVIVESPRLILFS